MSFRRACTTPRQCSRGFTLLELSVVLFLGAGFLMSMTLALHAHMLQLRAQAMAQRYQAVHAAVQRYVELFRGVLTVLPAACSQPVYQAGSPKSPPAVWAAGGCALSLNNVGRIAHLGNALQPTTLELQALGLLDDKIPLGLTLERDNQSQVFAPSFQGRSALLAPAQLGVLVRKLCDTPGCSGPAVFESLTYNLQPYGLRGGIWAFSRSDQVHVLLAELGTHAAKSEGIGDQGRLVGIGGQFTLDNPVSDASGLGLAGIVALRGSTQTALDSVWTRRDGQSRIAGDWDFSSYGLRGVSSLGVQKVQAQDIQLSGRADLNAAAVKSMTVGQFQADQILLPGVQIGQSCEPGQANVALDTASSRLLTCNRQTLLWGLP